MNVFARLAIISLAIVCCLAAYILSGMRGDLDHGAIIIGIVAGASIPAVFAVAAACHARITGHRSEDDFHGDQISGDVP